MKLQCLRTRQQKRLASDASPCGMSLFKKSLPLVVLFLLAAGGILSNSLGALLISSSRYCRAGVHRHQRRPVWGLLRGRHDRRRGGHPGGEEPGCCPSCSFCWSGSPGMSSSWCLRRCPKAASKWGGLTSRWGCQGWLPEMGPCLSPAGKSSLSSGHKSHLTPYMQEGSSDETVQVKVFISSYIIWKKNFFWREVTTHWTCVNISKDARVSG